jgi:hypothetical protein
LSGLKEEDDDKARGACGDGDGDGLGDEWPDIRDVEQPLTCTAL